MRLNTSNSSLFALSSLFFLSSSLPFVPRKAIFVEPLVRRATYSVVAVDGGAAAATTGGSSQGDFTIIETIIQTQAPATKTIIDVTTLPPVTDHVVSTKTIEGSDTTQTLVVTLTNSPSPTTVTATGYSIIDVNPVVTVQVTVPAATSSTSSLSSSSSSAASSAKSTSSSTTTTSATYPTTSSTSYTSSSSTSAGASSSSNYTSSFTLSIGSSISTTAAVTSPATKLPYDNGQWHTTYPSWNYTATAVTKIVKASPSTANTMPTLQATAPAEVPADSVPLLNSGDLAEGDLDKRGR